MTIYKTYSLAEAEAAKGYDARMAKRILSGCEGKYDRVSFALRGQGGRLARGEPGEVIYVKATAGKWGRSCEIRYPLLPSIPYQVAERLRGTPQEIAA